MNLLRRFVALPLLIVLAACANEPYPFPPQFVSTTDVGIRVLGAPPAPQSEKYNEGIAYILEKQSKLTDEDKAVLMHEDHIQPGMILDPVLGAGYTKEKYPALYTLLLHASSDAWRTGDEMQEYWDNKRPWLADSRVQLYAKPIYRPSYPSGHTTTNTTWAYVLGELFPEKQEAFLARASEIGYHRVAAGVHFPTDIDAGKRLAAFLFEKMKKNPQFQHELDAARAELGLPMQAANDNTPLPAGEAKKCDCKHKAQ